MPFASCFIIYISCGTGVCVWDAGSHEMRWDVVWDARAYGAPNDFAEYYNTVNDMCRIRTSHIFQPAYGERPWAWCGAHTTHYFNVYDDDDEVGNLISAFFFSFLTTH